MRKISQKVKNEILADEFYDKCARCAEGTCQGRITWEHAWTYAGRQIDAMWAIIPLCEYHHSVNTYQDTGDLNKRLNEYIALRRAKQLGVDLMSLYPRKNWNQIYESLEANFCNV